MPTATQLSVLDPRVLGIPEGFPNPSGAIPDQNSFHQISTWMAEAKYLDHVPLLQVHHQGVESEVNQPGLKPEFQYGMPMWWLNLPQH